MNEKYDSGDPRCCRFEPLFFGSATLGERGQIVIPAEARHDLALEPGDKLLVMRHPVHKGLLVCKIDVLREFMEDFSKTVTEIEKRLQEDGS